MNLKIHRGTREIGGSCVEVWTEKARILVDIGMPLVEKDGSEFSFKKYKNLPNEQLIESGILPDIKGIYKESEKLIDGVLISHPHQDHFGFANFLHDELKFYIGEAAFRIINTANLFINKDQLFKNHTFFERSTPFKIGDLTITPYWMDHSAFDAYAFLIEGSGKKVLYSGDFRSHGRKTGAYKWFLKNAPSGIDYLLLEGTMIGRGFGKERREEQLQEEFESYFKEDKINLVYASSQNIDRLVTIYKACNSANKILVIDPYTASILKESSKFANIQHPSDSFKNIRVFFPYFLTGRMLKSENKNLIFQFTKFKIKLGEINLNPVKYVLVIRPSIINELERMSGIDNGNLVYSLWDGYLKKEPTKGFVDYLKNRGYAIKHIHTSGHADIPTLKEFVNALNPGHIIPIHTFYSSHYRNIFNHPVRELADGEEIVV
ncbi:MBL fold metallo-hydrolase [Bacteroidota bacterium]